MRALVTGGAGFIGSALADRLVRDGAEVTIYDDFSTGRREFLQGSLSRSAARIVEGDVLDRATLVEALRPCDSVFHLAANADVRHGLSHPKRDLRQNTVATATVLEAMRETGLTRIYFASTGSVYGEPDVFPTPETCPFPVQTSLYGASKSACEGLIGAYCHGLGFTGIIFRFVSVLGERYTHGHVFDFYAALRDDPSRLHVLGDGLQEKSYLYVGDCVAAMLLAARVHGHEPGAHIYNLGTDETVTVNESVATITAHLGVDPVVSFAGGRRGWPGDSPLIHLDCARIRGLGWKPTIDIRQGIRRTLDWLSASEWIVGRQREPV